jgi:ABC-2 type transport system ATP-binding protein
MIKATNLSKRYGKQIAVNDVSFEVATGKVTGFLGPNGAGKSTTMRLMLGLDNGDGQTMYDGKPLRSYAEPGSIAGVLLEAKAFHPTRRARAHLRVLAAARGIADAEVDRALAAVGLSDAAKKRPGKFSLGMSQRLGLAAAILGRPKYLFLDEPANGLDPEGIVWLRQFIKDYVKEGNGVLVSSHLLGEMAQLADNVVVIGRGKLIASAPIEQLLSGAGAVYIRTSSLPKLRTKLKAAGLKPETQGAGLLVAGISTDEVGKLAKAADVTVLELVQQQASLEEAFLEMTENAQEYKTQAEPQK